MQNIRKALDLVEKSISVFEKSLPATERKMLDELLNLTKQLETKNGKIRANTANLKLLNKIKGRLNRIIINSEYLKDVAAFSKAFNQIATYQNNYFSTLGALSMQSKKVLTNLDNISGDQLQQALAGSGVEQNISLKIVETIKNAIVSGGRYSDLVTELNKVQSTSANQGQLSKYVKVSANDAINDYMGARNAVVAADLNSQWFMYVGSNLTTTREFCEHMTEKTYVHISEIPTILLGVVDEHQCEINATTNLPKGMIAGTNAENFIIYRGGWNCGHQLMPVSEVAVPEEVRKKLEPKETPPEEPPKPLSVDKSKILYEKIRKTEDEIRMNAKFETAVLYDSEGNIIIDKRGQATSVYFSDDEISKMKDAILTHNHPTGWEYPEKSIGRIGNSFSKEDVSLAIKGDVAEIRAVTPHYTFVMKRPVTGWSITETELSDAFGKIFSDIDSEFQGMFRNSKNVDLAVERANAVFFHKVWKGFAKQHDFEYSKLKTRN